MPTLELSEREASVLTEELESYLQELRTERLRTEKRDMRAEFVERENTLAGVITRLKARR